jgi:hypothetical protein
LLAPERLQRLVLVPSGGADEIGLSGTLATVAPASEIAVLFVRRETTAAAAVKLVTEFVGGSGAEA